MTARRRHARWLALALALRVPAAAADPAPRISFDETIRRAIAQNPSARVAVEEIARVAGLLAQASAALAPQISADPTYTRLEGNRYEAGHLAAAANSLDAAVVATMPIVDLEARANRDRAADDVATTAAAATSVRRDVALAAARTYFAALTAAQLVEVARVAREAARAHVDFATQRHTAGLGTDLDVVRAESELATDESQLASAVASQVRAEEALGVITGGDGPLACDGEPHLDLPARAPNDVDEREDVVASRARAGAATHSRQLGWTDWAPSLRVSARGFFTAPEVEPIPELGYEIDVLLDVPLYDGGLRAGADKQRRAVEAETHEDLFGVVRQARSDVRAADAALASARVAADAGRRAAAFATRALELTAVAYHGGTATSLDVVDAQRIARDAATQSAIADDDLREAELDLLAADGSFPAKP